MENEVKLTPWDDEWDWKLTLNEFIKEAEMGCLTDDDGYGYYATEEGYTDIKVYPSTVLHNWHKTEYPYINWVNK